MLIDTAKIGISFLKLISLELLVLTIILLLIYII